VSVALVIQHAERMRHIILSSAACLFLPYFSTLFHKRHDFWEKGTEYKMCVFILSTTLYKTFLILGRLRRDITINAHRSSCKVHVILVIFNKIRIYLTHFRNIFKYQKFQENPSSGKRVIRCGRTGRQADTDMKKPVLAFRNFGSA
jgi:hypothetical protein